MPGTKQEPEDREVDRRGDEWRDPDGHSEAEREAEDVAEAEQEGEADDGHDHANSLNDNRPV